MLDLIRQDGLISGTVRSFLGGGKPCILGGAGRAERRGGPWRKCLTYFEGFLVAVEKFGLFSTLIHATLGG